MFENGVRKAILFESYVFFVQCKEKLVCKIEGSLIRVGYDTL
jgi:hypothetical protein